MIANDLDRKKKLLFAFEDQIDEKSKIEKVVSAINKIDDTT